MSARAIAMVLGRAPSTISREVLRNAKAYDGAYRAEPAHSYAVARLRISGQRGRLFQRNVDGISDERGRRFNLNVDDLGARG